MRSRLPAAAVLALALCAASPARAGDASEESAKSAVEYFDKYVTKVKDDTKYAELVAQLADVPHAVTAERIGQILNGPGDEERRMIAADALSRFLKPKEAQEAAGKALVKALTKGDMGEDLLDTVVHSVGGIACREAVPALNDILLGGGSPYVLVTAVRSVGKIADRRALPALLELWERHPVGYSWETGEVKVDTGASGTTDQEAAEAQWNAKYGNKMKGKGKPPVMFKLYIQELVKSVAILTGEKTIGKPDQLRAWMEAHAEELKKEGVEVPKYKGPSKKKDDGKDKDGKDKDGKDKDGKK